MSPRTFFGLALLLIPLTLLGCDGGGGGGEQGVDNAGTGSFAQASTITLREELPVGDAVCPYGGARIYYGIDDDANGLLDELEIDGYDDICNGADALPVLQASTDEPPGTNCVNGGVRLDWGADLNGDGALDVDEITGSAYVCDGANSENPIVLSTNPLHGASDLMRHAGLSATFSQAMNAGTITTNSFRLYDDTNTSVPGSVSYSGDTATFQPSALLSANTGFTAWLDTSIEDALGRNLSNDYSWNFTTGTAFEGPLLTATSPASGEAGVAVYPVVTATFADTMSGHP